MNIMTLGVNKHQTFSHN